MADSERTVAYGVVVICVVWIIIGNIDTYSDINDVKENYAFTHGKINRYYHIGQSVYVEYTYIVNGVTYTRTKLDRHYQECERHPEWCEGKRFWVAYSKLNNENSLINFGVEIQNIQNPKPPASLDYFE